MALTTETVSLVADIAALLAFIIVVYYVINIMALTKGFGKIWFFMLGAFALFVARRALIMASPYIIAEGNSPVLENLIIPSLLILVSVFFVAGFFKLHKEFLRIVKEKRAKY